MSVCDDVMEWVELGASLHTPQSDLDNIEHTHGEDPARCRRELLKVITVKYMYMHIHVYAHCILILCTQMCTVHLYLYMYMNDHLHNWSDW